MSKKDQTTALVAGETLSYQRDGEDYQLPVGTSAWYGWLQTATHFRVRSPLGTFTMRREQAGHKRGTWYWPPSASSSYRSSHSWNGWSTACKS